ncbi:glycosyl transferase, family 2 [Pseudanabaena sp. lw0831]|uniref:GtrA family protein n=1 Tax=Pseudanabaena sp. lw0831 TaxID=1357935 RepID=UPI0019168D83|nr:GtrA family protein [Pseudanabaena sp. lw0831]GBO52094.1 glycosyl transferase, family 2 [Pseudanabaena sp. lw0831]
MQNFLQQIWLKLSEPRSLRFLVVGILGALTNILLLAALVDCLHWETTFLRSLANIIATEICLVASFFAYRQIVWQIEEFDWRLVLQTELPTYHLSIALVIAIRSLLLFPFMDWLGIDPVVNSGIGIGIGAILTYTLSEKFIFTARIPLS